MASSRDEYSQYSRGEGNEPGPRSRSNEDISSAKRKRDSRYAAQDKAASDNAMYRRMESGQGTRADREAAGLLSDNRGNASSKNDSPANFGGGTADWEDAPNWHINTDSAFGGASTTPSPRAERQEGVVSRVKSFFSGKFNPNNPG